MYLFGVWIAGEWGWTVRKKRNLKCSFLELVVCWYIQFEGASNQVNDCCETIVSVICGGI